MFALEKCINFTFLDRKSENLYHKKIVTTHISRVVRVKYWHDDEWALLNDNRQGWTNHPVYIVTFNKLPHYYCSVSFFITYFLSFISFHFSLHSLTLSLVGWLKKNRAKSNKNVNHMLQMSSVLFFVSVFFSLTQKWNETIFYIYFHFHISHFSADWDKFIVRWTKWVSEREKYYSHFQRLNSNSEWMWSENICQPRHFTIHISD